jgi:carboxymethylenebutenolidase
MCHEDCANPVASGGAEREEDILLDLPNGGHLPVFLAKPQGAATGAILLIHDIHGPNAFYHDLARRLANEGFLTALPDLFHRLPPPADDTREASMSRGRQLEQSEALSDLQVLAIWLRHHELANGKLGTMGFCMGGTLVLLLASREPAPQATVCYYGFPKRERTPLNPIMPSDQGEIATIASPILGFWGDQDKGVGPENVEAYSDALIAAGKGHDFLTYTGIGHGFLTFDPDAPAFENSKDAWRRTLEFYRKEFSRKNPVQ